jgi:transposase
MAGRRKKIAEAKAGSPEKYNIFVKLSIQQRQQRAALSALSKRPYSPAAHDQFVAVMQDNLKTQQAQEINALYFYEKTVSLSTKVEDLTNELARRTNELKAAMKIKNPYADKSDTDVKIDADKTDGKDNNVDEQEKKQKKRGAPKGHRGASRPVPSNIDDDNIIEPPAVCSCGCGEIIMTDEFDDRYIEDILPVIKHITRLRVQRGKCSACGLKLRHEDALTGPPTRIGPNFSTFLTYMRQNGLTFGQLQKTAAGVGFDLTRSGILGIVNRTTDSMEWVYDIIGMKLKGEDVLNVDETTWKVNSILWYIWVFCNKKMAYFYPIKSRAAKVIEMVLGEDFKGIAICDFYAAYNILKHTQRCLVHLLKDIKKERAVLKNNKQLEIFDQMIKTFINKGLEISKMPNGNDKQTFIENLKKYFGRITRLKPAKGTMGTLLKRIIKYKDDIFRFVENEEVEYHNNRAERQIRPTVISRKMSFGSHAADGAKRNCILHSVIETCKLQDVDPIEFIRNIMMNPDYKITQANLIPI